MSIPRALSPDRWADYPFLEIIVSMLLTTKKNISKRARYYIPDIEACKEV